VNLSPPSPATRPPWPDELPRLADAFPGFPFAHPMHLRVLAVPATATTPERLVALAALIAPAADRPHATLLLRIRERFLAAPTARSLVADLLTLARAEKFPTLLAPAQAEPDPRAALLRSAGFLPADDAHSWKHDLS